MLMPTCMSAKVYKNSHVCTYTYAKTFICIYRHIPHTQKTHKENQNLLGVNLCPHESYIEVTFSH